MALRSTNDIPEEIKNIIELFYLQSEAAARIEAENVRSRKPELASIVDDVLQLFPTAPESVFMFYDTLIATASVSDNIDNDLSFTMGEILGDPEDGAQKEDLSVPFPEIFDKSEVPGVLADLDNDINSDSFAELLNQSLDNPTQIPSIFADGTDGRKKNGESYGLKGRELSSQPKSNSSDISLDIDIDFDLLDSNSSFSPAEENHSGFDSFGISDSFHPNENAESASNPSDGATPLPNNIQTAQLDKLQEKTRTSDAPVPSIMRAMQKSQMHEEQIQARKLNDLLRADALEGDSHIRVTSHPNESESVSTRLTVPKLVPIEPEAFGSSASNLGIRCSSGHHRLPTADIMETERPTTSAISPVSPEHLPDDSRIGGLVALNKIQPVNRIPKVLCRMSELSKKQGINAKSGFILSMIDGVTSIADILDISAWSEGETAKLLLELKDMGIIEFT